MRMLLLQPSCSGQKALYWSMGEDTMYLISAPQKITDFVGGAQFFWTLQKLEGGRAHGEPELAEMPAAASPAPVWHNRGTCLTSPKYD